MIGKNLENDTIFSKSSIIMKKFKNKEGVLREPFQGYVPGGQGSEAKDIDLSLLEESLRLTPWERMLANDDALNFAESLRAALKRYRAES
jgi:hypothetical protein